MTEAVMRAFSGLSKKTAITGTFPPAASTKPTITLAASNGYHLLVFPTTSRALRIYLLVLSVYPGHSFCVRYKGRKGLFSSYPTTRNSPPPVRKPCFPGQPHAYLREKPNTFF